METPSFPYKEIATLVLKWNSSLSPGRRKVHSGKAPLEELCHQEWVASGTRSSRESSSVEKQNSIYAQVPSVANFIPCCASY